MSPGKIDDPVEASFEAWPEETENLGRKCGELALTFEGFSFTPAAVAKILRDQFATPKRVARIEYLLNGVRLGFQYAISQAATDRERLKEIEEKLKSAHFSEAVSIACEEAVRATNHKKIDRLRSVLVGSLGTSAWGAGNEDVAAMIRDIAQLAERDIDVLGVLNSVHSSAIAHAPNLNNSDSFSRETPALKRAVAKSGIHPDDFLSTCERLRGFGLAAEVLRNTSHMGPEDFCYRPTRRGLVLLDYLKSFPGVSGE
jgi:hypothetical protein